MFKKYFKVWICAFIFIALCLPAVPVYAVGGSDCYATTPYTGMIISPGKKYNFEVTIENKSSQIRSAALSVPKLPEGWAAGFDENGKLLTEVTIKPQNLLYINFVVTAPEEAKDGLYEVVARFTDSAGAQDIRFKLTIQREQASQLPGKLDVQFPELTGPSGAVFTYRVTYNNDTSANQSFSLASQIDDGWTISFKPMYENKTVASIVVDANGTQVLDVEVTPPVNIKAGKYTVPIAFLSDTERLETSLSLIIEGRYDLALSTKDERLNADAYAGKDTLLPVILKNTGTSPLTGIKLSAAPPEGWNAEFNEDESAGISLDPGESLETALRFRPSNRAVAGDYVLTIEASNYGVSKQTDIRVTVKTPVYWGVLGLLCIAVIVVLIIGMFRKYGRK